MAAACADMLTIAMTDPLSSSDARLVILEMTVAAVVAQLPPSSLEEVASMLTFVAGLADDTGEVAGKGGEEQLSHVRRWANEMLNRVMTSRKASRPESLDPAEAAARRYDDSPLR